MLLCVKAWKHLANLRVGVADIHWVPLVWGSSQSRKIGWDALCIEDILINKLR